MPSGAHEFLRPARPDCRLTLSPIIERTQAAVEREEEIKEAMNDALGASQRRITDLEGELEHAKAIAAAAEKSPDQGTEEEEATRASWKS